MSGEDFGLKIDNCVTLKYTKGEIDSWIKAPTNTGVIFVTTREDSYKIAFGELAENAGDIVFDVYNEDDLCFHANINIDGKNYIIFVIRKWVLELGKRREDIQDIVSKQIKEVSDKWKKELIKNLTKSVEQSLKDKEGELDTLNKQYNETTHNISVMEMKIASLSHQLERERKSVDLQVRFLLNEAVALIEEGHPQYESVIINEKQVIGITKPITIDYKSKKYELGQYKVIITLPQGGLGTPIKIEGFKKNPCVNGHKHPHVSSSGTPCLGITTDDVKKNTQLLLLKKEFIAKTLTKEQYLLQKRAIEVDPPTMNFGIALHKLILNMEIRKVLTRIYDFLCSYNPNGPYVPIGRLVKEDTSDDFEDTATNQCSICGSDEHLTSHCPHATTCPECGSSIHEDELSSHLRHVHNYIECPDCGLCFATSADYEEHREREHNENSSEDDLEVVNERE
jgi:predicted RNA-binding Zn-ribbon protein involved in translation (DUF1610 family)